MSHDSLFQTGQDSLAMLRIGRCNRCGHAFFPVQRLGCERCGAADPSIQEDWAAAEGVVKAAVTVFRHRSPDIEAPFQVAIVQLDAGPQVSALLLANPRTPVPAGTRVIGAAIEPSGSALPAFRFKLAEESRA